MNEAVFNLLMAVVTAAVTALSFCRRLRKEER